VAFERFHRCQGHARLACSTGSVISAGLIDIRYRSPTKVAKETAKSSEAEVEKFQAKIGQFVVELDFPAKVSGR
jgi:hypothetical protein